MWLYFLAIFEQQTKIKQSWICPAFVDPNEEPGGWDWLCLMVGFYTWVKGQKNIKGEWEIE